MRDRSIERGRFGVAVRLRELQKRGVIGDEHGGLRHQQIRHRFAQFVRRQHVFVVEREVECEDQRHFVVIGDHFRNGAD